MVRLFDRLILSVKTQLGDGTREGTDLREFELMKPRKTTHVDLIFDEVTEMQNARKCLKHALYKISTQKISFATPLM